MSCNDRTKHADVTLKDSGGSGVIMKDQKSVFPVIPEGQLDVQEAMELSRKLWAVKYPDSSFDISYNRGWFTLMVGSQNKKFSTSFKYRKNQYLSLIQSEMQEINNQVLQDETDQDGFATGILVQSSIGRKTREQAVEDGDQLDANEGDLSEVTKYHYKLPVYIDRDVVELLQKAINHPKWGNEPDILWNDILLMSKRCVIARPTPLVSIFKVKINGAGRKSVFTMRALCEPKDETDGSSVIVIQMEPEEK